MQFMDEEEEGGEPQVTAVQQCHEKTSYQAEEPQRSRSQDSNSHAWQEGLDQVRRSMSKLKSLVKNPDLLAASTVSSAM